MHLFQLHGVQILWAWGPDSIFKYGPLGPFSMGVHILSFYNSLPDVIKEHCHLPTTLCVFLAVDDVRRMHCVEVTSHLPWTNAVCVDSLTAQWDTTLNNHGRIKGFPQRTIHIMLAVCECISLLPHDLLAVLFTITATPFVLPSTPWCSIWHPSHKSAVLTPLHFAGFRFPTHRFSRMWKCASLMCVIT